MALVIHKQELRSPGQKSQGLRTGGRPHVYHVTLISSRASFATQILFNQNMSPLEFWQKETYYVLWVLQRHFLLAFWAKATYSGFEVFREGSYDPRHVLDR